MFSRLFTFVWLAVRVLSDDVIPLLQRLLESCLKFPRQQRCLVIHLQTVESAAVTTDEQQWRGDDAWLSNFWNKKCFDLPTRPDTVRFFLVCLFLSLTHDSSYLLTWVSYCCVRTLLRHFAVTDVSPQLHVATENQDTQEWSLRFLLVFFLYFFTVVLHSSLSSCLPRKVCSMSLFPSLPVILLLFFFLMWLYFYFLPLFFSHPHCCQM